jgi:hypothetical protein
MEALWILVFVGERAPSPILRALFFVFRVKVCRGGVEVVVTTPHVIRSSQLQPHLGGNVERCGDPRLAIRNTHYVFNSRSHDQCVMNPHNRVNNRITSSITVLNNILTIGHMTKSDIAMQGKSTIEQRTQAALMTHVLPSTLHATD